MDFFDREAHARRQTRRLVWLFGFAILAVLAVNNLLLCSFIYLLAPPVVPGEGWQSVGIVNTTFYLLGEALIHPLNFLKLILRWQPVLWVSCSTLLSIAGGSYYKMRQLAEGGTVVAEFLGGRCVAAQPGNLDEQRLRNVIGEMAVASGLSVPEIYVLDIERGINAFAAGYTHDDVAIGVTRGCLKLLTRDELQGVIAHEFSHILSGDTRFNMQMIGLAHGLFWPTLLGRLLMRGTTANPDPGETVFDTDSDVVWLPTAPVGLVFWLLGSVSLPFVRLIKSAICREREWLADAAAVRFTRNPAGIEGALKKVGGLFKQGRLDTPHAEVASHLYFAESGYEPWLDLLSAHPPLVGRISAIDPAFDGNFPRVKMLSPNQAEREEAFDRVVGRTMALERSLPESVLDLTGGVTAEHLRQVAVLRVNLPSEINRALQTPDGASSIVYALLLSADDGVRQKQLEILRTNLTPETWTQTGALIPCVAALGDRYKLVLAEFAVPALRENDLDEHDAFHQVMNQLVECDGSIGLFEYTLMKMVARQLRVHFFGAQTGGTRFGRVQDVLPECALLLSALAHVGADGETEARKAFANGVKFLDAPNASPQFLTRSEWDLSKVDAGLTRLAGYHDPLKRNLLMACGKTVVANGRVNEREAELLRAIADALGCPMPPFVEAIRGEELAHES